MAASLQLSGGVCKLTTSSRKKPFLSIYSTGINGFGQRSTNIYGRGGLRSCSLSLDRTKGFLSRPIVVSQRNYAFPRLNCVKSSDVWQQETDSSDASAGLSEVNGTTVSSQINEASQIDKAPITSQPKNVRHELMMMSVPAIGGQAIEPMVQLMETAYIGHLGSVELASAAVSISLFNIISKLFNIPLLSVATSFVAEDVSKNASKLSTPAKKLQLSSVSTALLLAVGIGIFEAAALTLGSGPFLGLMGISKGSSMFAPAQRFLILRALGAPAYVVSLALQGIFRGFKDTKTPVLCLGFGNFTAVFLFPLFMYYFRLGVYGAAISTVVSQYIVTFSIIWQLNKRAVLLPPKLGDLQFGSYLKSGGFLIRRTLSVLLTMTLGTSMAARQGPVAMAAHQICLQVWLAVSLLTDALAASAQALVATYVSKDDYGTVRDITHFVLKIGFVTGAILALILGVSFSPLATSFTKDIEILQIVRTGVLFVSASQPINALAFIFDGLHYGVSDFRYAAISMMLVGVISSSFLLYASNAFGLPGVWSGLTLFMGLRMAAGFLRLLKANGPWWFLHEKLEKVEMAA